MSIGSKFSSFFNKATKHVSSLGHHLKSFGSKAGKNLGALVNGGSSKIGSFVTQHTGNAGFGNAIKEAVSKHGHELVHKGLDTLQDKLGSVSHQAFNSAYNKHGPTFFEAAKESLGKRGHAESMSGGMMKEGLGEAMRKKVASNYEGGGGGGGVLGDMNKQLPFLRRS